MPNFTSVQHECEHEECHMYWLEGWIESSRELCCPDEVCSCEPVLFACQQK
jgi:hypothetical protein